VHLAVADQPETLFLQGEDLIHQSELVQVLKCCLPLRLSAPGCYAEQITLLADGAATAACRIPGFEADYVNPLLAKLIGGGKPGTTGTDNDDFLVANRSTSEA